MKKHYKLGDTIYYKCYDGTIESNTIKKIEPGSYKNDKGKIVNYNFLYTHVSENGGGCGIEDYNCLSQYNPAVIEYIREQKYKLQKESEKMYKFVFGTTRPTKTQIAIINKVLEYQKYNT